MTFTTLLLGLDNSVNDLLLAFGPNGQSIAVSVPAFSLDYVPSSASDPGNGIIAGLLSGTALGSGVLSGSIVGIGLIISSASGASSIAGAITGFGKIAGLSAGTSTVTGTVTNASGGGVIVAPISGTINGRSTVVGTLVNAGIGWYGGGGIRYVGRKAPKPKRAQIIAAVNQIQAVEVKSVDQVLNEVIGMFDTRIAQKDKQIAEMKAIIAERKRQIDEEEIEILMWAA